MGRLDKFIAKLNELGESVTEADFQPAQNNANTTSMEARIEGLEEALETLLSGATE